MAETWYRCPVCCDDAEGCRYCDGSDDWAEVQSEVDDDSSVE